MSFYGDLRPRFTRQTLPIHAAASCTTDGVSPPAIALEIRNRTLAASNGIAARRAFAHHDHRLPPLVGGEALPACFAGAAAPDRHATLGEGRSCPPPACPLHRNRGNMTSPRSTGPPEHPRFQVAHLVLRGFESNYRQGVGGDCSEDPPRARRW